MPHLLAGQRPAMVALVADFAARQHCARLAGSIAAVDTPAKSLYLRILFHAPARTAMYCFFIASVVYGICVSCIIISSAQLKIILGEFEFWTWPVVPSCGHRRNRRFGISPQDGVSRAPGSDGSRFKFLIEHFLRYVKGIHRIGNNQKLFDVFMNKIDVWDVIESEHLLFM